MKEELGKIQTATFGFGGYQDIEFGLSLVFSMSGAGVSTFIKVFDMGGIDEIKSLMKDAGVLDIAKLKDVPVMITFEGQRMTDFRVLKEVL